MKNVSKKYLEWVKSFKKSYREARNLANVFVHDVMINNFYELGKGLVEVEKYVKEDDAFFESLAKDFQNDLGSSLIFSVRNLKSMKQFYKLFPENMISDIDMAYIGCVAWESIVCIINSVDGDSDKALFFIIQTVLNNWSISVLSHELETDLYEQSKEMN